MTDLREWLEARGLQRYAEALLAQDIDLDILPSLTDADLTAVGLPVGARKRVLRAVEELRTDDSKPRSAFQLTPAAVPAKAERRQLTVLFCDIVDSTPLAEKLDPEDLRQLLLSFQNVCADAVQRNEGQIGLFVGDGVTAYFGYPQAHEDSAQRAVQAGLEIMADLAKLQIAGLQARCGVHTGAVVVGEMGAGEKRLSDGIVGEAPNIAARLQGLAPSGCLILSEATLRLVEGFFDVEPLGSQHLKGVSSPVETFRVLRASAAHNRFEARTQQNLTTLIGREIELGSLTKRWEISVDGEGQAVLVQGEAGIGKSRLLQALRIQLREISHNEIVFYCSPQHQTSMLWPVIQQMHRTLAFSEGEDSAVRRERLRQFIDGLNLSEPEEAVAVLAGMLGLLPDAGSNTVPSDPEQVRRALFSTLLQITLAMAAQSPLLLIVEDAHWLDPSTAELIGQTLSRLAQQRLFVLLTARPDFRPPWPNSQFVTLSVSRLSRRETEAMIRSVAPLTLSEAVMTQLAAKADGVPLFIEELTKSVAESGNDIGANAAIEIPATLQAALHTRLDRLAPIRQTIQVAALLGRVFDADVLLKVSQQEPSTLKQALQELLDAELIYPRRDQNRESYEFKHALIQDAAISTLLRNQKAQLHRQIAASLTELRSDAIVRNPELLAYHLQEATDWDGALEYWEKAGGAAMARAAIREAISHFTNAIACTKKTLEVSGGPERITRIHLALATALMQSEGYRSNRLGQTLDDARVAAENTSSMALRSELTLSLAAFFFATGRNREYLVLAGEQIKNVAGLPTSGYLSALFATKGIAHFNRGENRLALEALRKATDAVDQVKGPRIPVGGADQRIVILLYLVRVLTSMGLINEALKAKEIFFQTTELVDPFDVAWALLIECGFYALFGQYEMLMKTAVQLIELSERHGYASRRSNGLNWRGVARTELCEMNAGIDDIREGVMIWRGQGVVFHTPERICTLCNLLVRADRLDEADQLLDDADTLVVATDEAAFAADVLRVRGQIAAKRGNFDGAVESIEKAIVISQQQAARLIELRATTNLAQVLRQLGRSEEGRARLAALVKTFDTKHEIIDLVSAREVLNAC